jgi:site-specific recombinase XerD
MIEKFLQEKKYLDNVSPKTIILYESCFKAFKDAVDTEEQIKQRIMALRDRGVSPVTVNTYLRHIKCFYLWQGKPWKLPWLKEEKKILSTFSPAQVAALIHWKPVGRNNTRVRVAALTALDTGLRVGELLGLTRLDVDFENLVLRVKGKGNKHRLVPMSIELRKLLFRHFTTLDQKHVLIFRTRGGGKLSQRNLLRDFKVSCKKLGIAGVRCSFHTLRHTFAVSYLRAGGNLFYLSRILGHTSVKTTEKYLQSLGVEDLQKVHDALSLLTNN